MNTIFYFIGFFSGLISGFITFKVIPFIRERRIIKKNKKLFIFCNKTPSDKLNQIDKVKMEANLREKPEKEDEYCI